MKLSETTVPSLAEELVDDEELECAEMMDPGPFTWGGMTPRLLAASIGILFESKERLASTLVIEGPLTCRERLLVTLGATGVIFFWEEDA